MNLQRSRWQAFSRASTPWVLALVLLAFLAPGMSRALGVPGIMPGAGLEDRAGWVEVCGAGGVRWVALDAAASERPTSDSEAPVAPAGHASDLEHCALCGLNVDRGLAPPGHVPVPPVSAGAGAARTQCLPSATTAYTRPQATGPPFLS